MLPRRPLFDALLKHRKENPEKYLHMGLFTDNGKDWHYLRNLVNPILRPGATEPYISHQYKVARDFLSYLENDFGSNGQVNDMLHHLYKYTQEAIGIICFGKRLDCFNRNSNSASEINENVVKTLDAMGKTLFQVPLWKLFPMPTYRSLVKSQSALMKITETLLVEAKQCFQDDPTMMKDQPFLSSLLSKQDLDIRDLNLIMLEMFQAGIDATASAIALTLYHLGRNMKIQDKLMAELDHIAPLGTPITGDTISKLKYMRMCIKETLRLTPPVGGSARLLNSTLVLLDYEIPAGTLVIAVHPVMSCTEAFVQHPNEYEPMRWFRQNGKTNTIPPFVSLPFGFGTRACPGKRIAEQEMMLFFIMLFQKYRCHYYGNDVSTVMRLNYLPDKLLNFTLTERH